MVNLKPETERLVQEEMRSSNFHSIDEFILQAVRAWRLGHQDLPPASKPAKRIYDLLTQPPFAGSGLIIESDKEYPREVDLG